MMVSSRARSPDDESSQHLSRPGQSIGTAAADLITEDLSTIQRELNTRGIGFERWTASIELAAEADEASILGSYADDVNRVKQAHGFITVDAIRMTPEHPERIALRNKFLSEHTHSEDEVRFFVEGRGLFNLHIKDEVLSVLCERGDLIHVPAGTKHWFDMGSRPQFCALRFFNNPAGWVADFSNDPIAERFPRLD